MHSNRIVVYFYYQLDAQVLCFNIFIIHVSSTIMLIFRRTNCISTASGTVTVFRWPFSIQATRGPVPDAVLIQFVLLKMSIILLETCRGVQ